MINSTDIKLIKKHYGEKFSKLCRDLFPKILETENLLFKILSDNFDYNRSLHDDILSQNKTSEFKNYIFSKTNNNKTNEVKITKTPSELMNQANYTLYKCKTAEDVNSYKKYYKKDEELCTFRDDNRINTNHIWFGIRNDINDIKRSENPRREDDYGVSVISIQVEKRSNWLSIKNRYNHTVNNCDATFSNNLDNIIIGLTESFNKTYNLKINKSSNKNDFELDNYIKASDNKYYKYNYEINNVYYCVNNIVINNGEIIKYDKSKFRLIDYFLVDKQNKIMQLIDKNINDCFIDINDCFIDINKDINKIIEIDNKIIINNDIVISLNVNNNIIGYKNNNVTSIGNNFLYCNKELTSIELNNVTSIGNHFLFYNKQLQNIELNNVTSIGNDFLYHNEQLKNIELNSVTSIGNYFLCYNEQLKNIELNSVTSIGNNFLYYNEQLKNIELNNVTSIGNYFLRYNKQLKNIELNSVTSIGNYFLCYNEQLKNKYKKFQK